MSAQIRPRWGTISHRCICQKGRRWHADSRHTKLVLTVLAAKDWFNEGWSRESLRGRGAGGGGGQRSSRHLMVTLNVFSDPEDILGIHLGIDGVVLGHQLLNRECT